MKILFTGMASHHTQAAETHNFITGISKLAEDFAEVHWSQPDVQWKKKDFDQYDLVFVGICPPSALSANKAYGALGIIDTLWSSDKLRLIADYPQTWQYKASFIRAADNPGKGLFPDSYAKRLQFSLAVKNQKKIISACTKLATQKWPKTIYPSLPWKSADSVADIMGLGSKGSLVGLNVDNLYLTNSDMPSEYYERENRWLTQDEKNAWTKTVLKTTRFTHEDLRKARRDDHLAQQMMQSNIGLLVSPEQRRTGVWWSKRIPQALRTRTPIITDWKETQDFHWSWSRLAYQLEDMTPVERSALADWQLKSYLEAIPDEESLKLRFSDILFSSDMKEVSDA